MIDGVGNYAADPVIEARCHEATAFLDNAINEVLSGEVEPSPSSITTALSDCRPAAGKLRANVKLAISGGQNEPRDAIAGCVHALLSHPDEMAKIRSGDASWLQVFEEYARWTSPIGMSPREIRQDFEWNGILLEKGQRIFLMSARQTDETHFDAARTASTSPATRPRQISFGAGPHFWRRRSRLTNPDCRSRIAEIVRGISGNDNGWRSTFRRLGLQRTAESAGVVVGLSCVTRTLGTTTLVISG
ncbi:MAG: hypothetical protein R3D34_10010 [Nitratireductor sp.]